MAGIIRCQSELQSENNSVGPLTVDELQATEKAIVARVQWNVYPQEMKLLSSCNSGDANLTVVQSTHCYDKTYDFHIFAQSWWSTSPFINGV